jgi:hypothetical protein
MISILAVAVVQQPQALLVWALAAQALLPQSLGSLCLCRLPAVDLWLIVGALAHLFG